MSESTPHPATETTAPLKPDSGPDPKRRRIEEVVVCSNQGEMLYAWQCPDMEERLKLLECLQLKAKQLSQALVLGRPDRWELEGPEGLIVTQFQPDWKIWVRSSMLEPEEAA